MAQHVEVRRRQTDRTQHCPRRARAGRDRRLDRLRQHGAGLDARERSEKALRIARVEHRRRLEHEVLRWRVMPGDPIALRAEDLDRQPARRRDMAVAQDLGGQVRQPRHDLVGRGHRKQFLREFARQAGRDLKPPAQRGERQPMTEPRAARRRLARSPPGVAHRLGDALEQGGLVVRDLLVLDAVGDRSMDSGVGHAREIGMRRHRTQVRD